MKEVEEEVGVGILDPKNALVIALSRMGAHPPPPSSASDDHTSHLSYDGEHIVSGTLDDLLSVPPEDHQRVFGSPLHSLIVVGKRLHVLEAEYAEAFAVNKENWRRVVKDVYCVTG